MKRPSEATDSQSGNQLSESLGDVVRNESRLGAPTDIDKLRRRITLLKQDLADKRGEVEKRTEELFAARAE